MTAINIDILLAALLWLCGIALFGILYLTYKILTTLRQIRADFRESQKNLTNILLRTNSELLAAIHDLERKVAEKLVSTLEQR
jgi:hypothetical protein